MFFSKRDRMKDVFHFRPPGLVDAGGAAWEMG